MQYDGKGNIASWIPIPTDKTSHNRAGTTTHVANAWPDDKAPKLETKFKLVKR